MKETQDSIARWSRSVFGDSSTPARVAARVNEEMAELLRTMASPGNKVEAAEEAADVTICLAVLGSKLHFHVYDPAIVPIGALKGMTSRMTAASEACSANQSLGYLLSTIALEESADIDVQTRCWIAGRECVDRLWRMCRCVGADLIQQVDRKMVINRGRRWKVDESGCGYHQKGAGA